MEYLIYGGSTIIQLAIIAYLMDEEDKRRYTCEDDD